VKLETPFRRARKEDAPRIAELFRLSSGGVADYVWSTMESDYPGLTTLQIGARRYARDDIAFSYKNCVVAEADGEVVGMLVAFPMEAEDGGDGEDADPGQDETEGSPAIPAEPDVLAPYAALEVPGSFYICGMAVLPEYRNQGLGTRFLAIAHALARERGCRELSLIAFAQNTGAVALYERSGYMVIDRRPVVPHPLIQYTGDALLMTAPVATGRTPRPGK